MSSAMGMAMAWAMVMKAKTAIAINFMLATLTGFKTRSGVLVTGRLFFRTLRNQRSKESVQGGRS